ncbi:MAG: SDR family NAD(P)-dependent oxidoreductase [Kofleriaceae bacterium]|nr:SDR family NAD(P)-dependent oxidoreductase [Kofleriaceae bacterium]
MEEIVVITGGTAGVGRAFARRYARQGAKIAVLSTGLDELRETAIDLVTRGAKSALVIPCDVANPEQLARATSRIEQDLGPIDIWIDASPVEPHGGRRRAIWLGAAIASVMLGAVAVVFGVRR